MKARLMNTDFALKLLVICSITMLVFLLVGLAFNWPKLIGSGFLIFILAVGWNLYLMMRSSGIGPKEIANYLTAQAGEAWQKKKWFEYTLYSITLPMISIGAVMCILILTCFFFIL